MPKFVKFVLKLVQIRDL